MPLPPRAASHGSVHVDPVHELLSGEAVAIARERIAQAAVLHPGACLADFVSHLSGVVALAPFLDRLNGNLLQGADIEAFFAMSAPNGRMH